MMIMMKSQKPFGILIEKNSVNIFYDENVAKMNEMNEYHYDDK